MDLNLSASKGSGKLALIRQAEMTECGVACLAMLMTYHGIYCNLPHLRRACETSSRGASLKDLSKMAQGVGFELKGYRVDKTSGLDQLAAPFIAHYEDGHFVVVRSISKKKVTILDPAKGQYKKSLSEFSKIFSGIIATVAIKDEVLAQEAQRNCKKINYLDLLPKDLKLAKNIFITLLLTILFQGVVILSPLFGQYVIDTVIIQEKAEFLAVLAAAFCGLTLLQVSARLAREFYIFVIYRKLSKAISSVLFDKITSLNIGFFIKRHTGDILSRLDSMNQLRDLLARDLVSYVIDGLLVVLSFSIMFYYSRLLASIVAALTVIYVLMRLYFYSPIKSLTEEKLSQRANYDSYLIETVKSARPIRIFGDEKNRKSKLSSMMMDMVGTEVTLGKWYVSFSSVHAVIVGIETILVIYFGAKLISVELMSVGMLFAFLAYKDMFLHSMIQFIDKLIELKLVGVHLERMHDIVYEESAVEKPEFNVSEDESLSSNGVESSCQKNGSGNFDIITISGLCYRYSKQDDYILKNVNFNIPRNLISVIVAPSGYGKTTLIDCLTGLEKPSLGAVYYKGVNVYDNPAYRKILSAVGQKDFLYAGTLKDNITLFSNNVDERKLVYAASVACIHDDIVSMKLGYNTFVGDMGASLSGGQVQRVLIARAIYVSPEILFLDEATSQIDASTEYKINQNLRSLGITIVMAAHRTETIAIADNIIDLQRLGENDYLKAVQR